MPARPLTRSLGGRNHEPQPLVFLSPGFLGLPLSTALLWRHKAGRLVGITAEQEILHLLG